MSEINNTQDLSNTQENGVEIVKKEKKKKGINYFYYEMVKFFSSRILRNLTAIFILVISLMIMFFMDETNYVRDEFLPFLNENFVKAIMDWLQVPRYNVPIFAWLLFICLFVVVLIFAIADIIKPKIVDKLVEKNKNDFSKKKRAKMFYNIMYSLVVLLIGAAFVFLFYMLGGFDKFNNTYEAATTAKIFAHLLKCALILLGFVLGIPLTIFLIYFLFKFLLLAFGYVRSNIRHFADDIEAKRGYKRDKARREMEEARRLQEERNRLAAELGVSPDDLPGGGANGFSDGRDIFPALTRIDMEEEIKATKAQFSDVIEEEKVAEPVAETAEAAENGEAEAVATDETAVADYVEPVAEDKMTLNEFTLRFQAFAAQKYNIYYELPVLRAIVSGMAASRLVILEGLSGTGKSMFPRMLKEFTMSEAFFTPVQATWRDKTDMLGFYSEFTKRFRCTEFLEHLYKASYSDRINFMVLDEMNLSRIEYYFADFLSVLEYPSDEWRIKVYDPEIGQKMPKHLEGGYIKIPENTWFFGTANTDDSTFTITDKVYDRAIVFNFYDKFSKFETDYNSDQIDINAEGLVKLFEEAQNDESKCLSEEDLMKFTRVCECARESFGVCFGNRIMVQIERFVPVYVAMGGTKDEALDHILTTKILRKLPNQYDDYLRAELLTFQKLLISTYGKGTLKAAEEFIAKMLERL